MRTTIICSFISTITFILGFILCRLTSTPVNHVCPTETIVEIVESVDTIATYPDGNFLNMNTYGEYTDISFNFNGVIKLNIDPSETLEVYNDLLHMQAVLDEYIELRWLNTDESEY